jgi:hypothetical protein
LILNGNVCAATSWDVNSYTAMNTFPEVAMMEAVEGGYNVSQFSTIITDPPSPSVGLAHFAHLTHS